jgi:STE24 endopeptidase
MGEGRAPRWQRSPAIRLGATAVAALIVAEAAAWLLRPKEVVDPVPVSEHGFFDPEYLETARQYRSGQRLLLVGSVATQGALLLLLVGGRPRWARRALERAGARPVIGGALATSGLYGAVAVTALPFDLAAHERAVDVGLSTQDLPDWALDWAKAAGIGAALAAPIGSGALALIRRFGRWWWAPGSAAVVGVAVLFTWLAPVVLAPAFNDFERLEPGPARSDALELGRRANVEIGEVYRVDASRRSTAINAYVGGVGPTKRVVLYDTLLSDLDRGERRSVIAHELAHVKGRDVWRGLLWLAITAPLSLLLLSRLADSIARRGGEPGRPTFLPALALALAVTAFGVGVVGNRLSRAVEARADTFALELTDDPAGLIELQQTLAKRNISDPDPPDVVSFLLGTHPTAVERIGAAIAWRQGERP